MMRVALYLTAFALLAGSAFFAYRVNYAAQEAVKQVARLQASIAREQEAIAVLQAEWAFLSAPERVATLAARHADALGLAPLQGDAFAAAVDLPFPPPHAFWVRADPSVFAPAVDAVVAEAAP